jgi:putative hydrolases of HD superfamily
MKKLSRKFNNLIDFFNFTHEFREVIRIARSPNGSRMENDAEHSYQLAAMAWYIIDQDRLNLNKELCFMYALSHDLVEVYAGDTLPYDKKRVATKHKREKEALERLKKRFPNFGNLIKTIEKYERKDDEESKFIYALDKLLPPLQCYLDKGHLWHEYKISFDAMAESKNGKIAISKDVNKYWQELFEELKSGKTKLFPS